MSTYYTLLTPAGASILATAIANKTAVDFVTFQLGDGSGAFVNPTTIVNGLKNKVYSAAVTNCYPDPNTAGQILVELDLPASVGGFTIREFAILDGSGDILAVGNYPAQTKTVSADGSVGTFVVRAAIAVTSTSAVSIISDQTDVMASQAYVQDQLASISNTASAAQTKANTAESDAQTGIAAAAAAQSTANQAESDAQSGITQAKAAQAAVASLQTGAGLPFGSSAFLTNLLYPSVDGKWRDIVRAGWIPDTFNHQWGGAYLGHEMVDNQTDNLIRFEPATLQIQDDTSFPIGSAASNVNVASGFKVGETGTYGYVWVKLAKVGSANQTVTFSIYTDNGSGLPSAAISGATATMNLLRITSKAYGAWYRLPLTTPAALTAGTQYYVVATTGTTNSTNYPVLKGTTRSKYPLGNYILGTSSPTWTSTPGYSTCFMVESPSANTFLQSSGLFDQQLKFLTGSPINQSKGLQQPAKNFFDGKQGSIIWRGTVPTASASEILFDIAYGVDHDRLVGFVSATGVLTLYLYRGDGTLYSLSGTAIAGLATDVGVTYRVVGDGADFITLTSSNTGGTTTKSLTAQTFTMSEGWRDLAQATLGCGLPESIAWTVSSLFTALPSTLGYTFTGTAGESNVMSILNSRLFQSAGAYATTDTGYYTKASAGFSNANGWSVVAKARIESSSGASTLSGEAAIQILDGTKALIISMQEGFIATGGALAGTPDAIYQVDLRSAENVIYVTGKGSDYFVYINNKLVIDGTGKLTTTTSTNSLSFGDLSAVSGYNADVVWAYVKYTTAAVQLRKYANAALLSEFATWSGNQAYLFPLLYNSGTRYSVKSFCGGERNYLDGREAGLTREFRKGITSAATTAALVAAPAVEAEMEMYGIGTEFNGSGSLSFSNSTAGTDNFSVFSVDGSLEQTPSYMALQAAANHGQVTSVLSKKTFFGLHKVAKLWYVSAGTMTRLATAGNMNIETRT
jgi:hypothetical protein